MRRAGMETRTRQLLADILRSLRSFPIPYDLKISSKLLALAKIVKPGRR